MNTLDNALKVLRDVMDNKLDIAAISRADHAVLWDIGAIKRNKNGNTFITLIGRALLRCKATPTMIRPI
jgi:hypothetical protein